MMRLALAQVLAHRVRLALTVVAVVLGVAFVTGSLVLNDTAQRLFDTQFRTASAGADLTIRQATAFDSGMGVEVERDPLPAELTRTASAVPQVTAAIPVAKGAARIETDGTDLGAVQLTTWVGAPVGAYPVREGRSPAGASEVVLDAASADRLGLTIGDTVVLVAEQSVRLRVVGLVGFGEEAGPPTGTVALTSLSTAQLALGLDDRISEILVTTDAPVGEVQPVLAAALGEELEIATAQDLAAAGAEAAAANLEMLQVVLIAMSAAALLIGAFLIANTFAMVVAQRTRELALLRATGATGGQVLRSVLAEALLVGLLASATGVLVGVAAAAGLRELAEAFGTSIPDGDLVLEARTILVAMVLGLVVTFLSAVGPARRASNVAPMLVLRSQAAEAADASRIRTGIGAALLAAGSLSAGAAAVGAPVALLAIGVVAAVVGVVLAAPAAIPLLAHTIGAGLGSLGTSGRLAAGSAARAPRRTASTVMALALGLALMIFVSVVGSSVRAATGEVYREVIAADVVIESAGQEMLGGVHAAVFDEVIDSDSVGSATRLKYGHWRDGESTSALTALDPNAIVDVARVRMVRGELEALAAGGVVIAERVAVERRLTVGDRLTMTFARTGATELPIVGVVEDRSAQALMTDYFISLDTYAQLFTEDMDASIFVTAANGVSAAQLHDDLSVALEDHPTVEVRDQAAVIAGRTQAVDQILGLVTVLLLLAVVIAVMGITNTLTLSIVERTREIGLLRAVGMTRNQAALMMLAEAVIVAVIAVLVGGALGIGSAAAAVGVLGQIAPLDTVIPTAAIAWFVALTAAAGVIAGVLPARRVAKLEVLHAIASV